MGTVDDLLLRNAGFASRRFAAGLRMMPSLATIVVGCVDPRVDPAEVLGLEPGEAAVVRNIGGRVTPSVLHELALLWRLTQLAGADLDQGWTLVVLQHTDCGILRMRQEPAMLAEFLGVDEAAVPDARVDDPRAAVQVDLDTVRDGPRLPAGLVTVGLVYDVATGRVERVSDR